MVHIIQVYAPRVPTCFIVLLFMLGRVVYLKTVD